MVDISGRTASVCGHLLCLWERFLASHSAWTVRSHQTFEESLQRARERKEKKLTPEETVQRREGFKISILYSQRNSRSYSIRNNRMPCKR